MFARRPAVRAARPLPQRSPPRAIAHRTAAAPQAAAPATEGDLTMRPVTAQDLPWLMSWSAEIGLPAPRSRHVRSFIFYKDGQRVGYAATRVQDAPGANGPERIVWIISVFVLPHMRRKGLVPRFAELATRQYYGAGKFGARVARDNHRMRKFMEETGWTKTRESSRWVDYTFTLEGPWSRDPQRRSPPTR